MPFVDVQIDSGPIVKPASFRQALPAVFVGCFAALGGILYGVDTGVISSLVTMEAFRKQYGRYWPDNIPSNTDLTNPTPGYDISTAQMSLVVSILSAGTFVGSLIGGPLADTLGRRWGLQLSLLVFSAGVAMQVASSSLPLFDAGRVVAGLGIGIVSTIVPLYQSETAPRWIRGAVVSGYQWAITIGLLIAAVINNATKDLSSSAAYRIPVATQFGLAAMLSIGLVFLPESPKYLIKQGRPEEAARSLAKLNSTDAADPLVVNELNSVQAALDAELSRGSASYLDCFKGGEHKNRLRTLTGMALQAFQQLSGINFIFYYGTSFFLSTQTNGSAYTFTIISNIVNVLCTLPGMFLMEKIGRRRLLIGGAVWMALCELIVALIGTFAPKSNTQAQSMLVAAVCLYIAAFAATWGPAAWVVCGEIFPLAIRAKSLSLCVAANWLLNWSLGFATPHLVQSGKGNAGLGTKVFFIWTATCAGGAIFSYFFIYESSNLSLEEVDELYCSSTCVKSRYVNAEIRARRDEAPTFTPGKFDESNGNSTVDLESKIKSDTDTDTETHSQIDL